MHKTQQIQRQMQNYSGSKAPQDEIYIERDKSDGRIVSGYIKMYGPNEDEKVEVSFKLNNNGKYDLDIKETTQDLGFKKQAEFLFKTLDPGSKDVSSPMQLKDAVLYAIYATDGDTKILRNSFDINGKDLGIKEINEKELKKYLNESATKIEAGKTGQKLEESGTKTGSIDVKNKPEIGEKIPDGWVKD